jgi:DNA repair protein RadC
MKIKLSVSDKNAQASQPDLLAYILTEKLKQREYLDRDKEHFILVGLTARLTIKYIEIISIGSLTTSVVTPRETFRKAIMESTACVLIAHNHPSGVPEPSDEDLHITRKLIDSGKILGIEVLDHIIITADPRKFYSFKCAGII